MKKYIYLLFYCFVCSLPLFAQENGTPRKQAISQKDIFISFDCVKHLVFPVQVSDIAIGEQELVMASRVEDRQALGASGRIHRRDQPDRSLHRRKRLHLSHPLPSRRRHVRGQREMAAP